MVFSKVSSTGVHNRLIEFSVTERFGSIAYFSFFFDGVQRILLANKKKLEKRNIPSNLLRYA